MALYLGTSKRKIIIDSIPYKIHFKKKVIPSHILLSSDDYLLKDKNGLYLTFKEDENND